MDSVGTLADTAKVIDKISTLRSDALLALVVVILAAFIYRIIAARNTRKACELDQQRKAQRAQQMADSLNGLADTMRQHMRDEGSRSTRMENTLREILATSSGYFSWEDSVRLMEDTFTSRILKDFQRIAETSIYRNSYAKNKEHIRLRVISAFDMIVRQALDKLTRYSLSISPTHFFPRDGEHYNISTLSWEAVERAHESRVSAVNRRETAVGGKASSASSEAYAKEITAVHAENVYLSLAGIFEREFDRLANEVDDVYPEGHATRIIANPAAGR